MSSLSQEQDLDATQTRRQCWRLVRDEHRDVFIWDSAVGVRRVWHRVEHGACLDQRTRTNINRTRNLSEGRDLQPRLVRARKDLSEGGPWEPIG
jgi:hypothetical protein